METLSYTEIAIVIILVNVLYYKPSLEPYLAVESTQIK